MPPWVGNFPGVLCDKHTSAHTHAPRRSCHAKLEATMCPAAAARRLRRKTRIPARDGRIRRPVCSGSTSTAPHAARSTCNRLRLLLPLLHQSTSLVGSLLASLWFIVALARRILMESWIEGGMRKHARPARTHTYSARAPPMHMHAHAHAQV